MGILSTIGNVVDKAEEMLGLDNKEAEKQTESGIAVEAAAGVETAQLQTEPTANNYQSAATQTYTVQHGDTLSKISERYFGNAHDYMKIFDANKDKLSDPDNIEAG